MYKVKHFHLEDIFTNRIKRFQKLMRYKIREILLVSSLYDYYLFEEDGRLYELIREEYQSLNLSHAPEITHVTTGEEAIELANRENNIDLVITTMHIEDMHVVKFAEMYRKAGFTTPIILLAYDNKERKELVSKFDPSAFDRIFIWQGDYKLLIGIIKYVEDRLNLENDTKTVGVQSIILVEDNVKFYSSYLPLIYTEIFLQSQRLIAEGINLTHKFLRMRARPKIILCTTYEEAWSYYEKYRETILGIILDINFKHFGKRDPEAGIKFALKVKDEHEDIPILLQSSNPDFASKAEDINVGFLQKGSPRLLNDLRSFMINNFGFGDFVFKTPEGKEAGRATDLQSLEEQLMIVPDESIQYHAERNHYSKWLKARTEFWLAHKLRPRRVSDFGSIDHMRKELIDLLRRYKEYRQRGIITEFSKTTFDPKNSFARIGQGSLGGKARGLGFINILINHYKIRDKFPDVELTVPSAIVIATDMFDRFLKDNRLEAFAFRETNDGEIIKKFLKAKKFPKELIERLTDFLEVIKEPLAVRSSSLLEDSQFQPFAGVYETYMIPNNHPDPKIRLQQLLQSIKSVYASTFYKKAKDYMKATQYRLEEEKMAVIIQQLVGAKHEKRFYPDFAGVAKSYNFYPVPPQKASDGIAQVALGLGKQVVEGGRTVRFCPKYPKHMLQFFSTKETIRNAQQDFYALSLDPDHKDVKFEKPPEVKKYDLSVAEKDETLFHVGSTYSMENEAVYDGISREGKRVVTFAPILKHKIFPLAEILELLLELGTWGMGVPIEIEFAVNLKVPPGKLKEFAMLQMRPLVISHETDDVVIDIKENDNIICESTQVLGHGAINDIKDIIAVDIKKYNRSRSREVAHEVNKLNQMMIDEKKPYLLIGVGRWGSFDPWLGIPVTWDQISNASVIVEASFKDLSVTPSQGSHFFQNITSFRVGYFTVDPVNKSGSINWDWIDEKPAKQELKFTKHIQLEDPLKVIINGHKNRGIIIEPGNSKK